MDNTSSLNNNMPNSTQTTPYMGRFGFGEIERYDQFIVALYLNKSALWILTIVAVVCNTLAFLTIMLIKPFGTSSFYVALLAVLDTLVMVMRLLYQQLTANDVPIGDAGCAILSFLGSFVLHLSTWTLATMTIERFVAVWFPLRVSELFTMRRAKLSIVIISFILILLNMHILWMSNEYINPFPPIDRDCGFKPEYMEFVMNVWYWVNSCIYAFLPCASLIVLNAMIIFKMNQSFKMQKQMTNADCSKFNKQNQQRQITVMLVTVSLVFVICLLPICVFYLVHGKRNDQTNLRETAKYYMTHELVYFLAELHHAVNFFFYVFSSRKFRKMMVRLVTCKSREGRRSLYQSQPSNTAVSTLTTSVSTKH